MRNLPDELETALREGLQAQPVPVISPDFDARVLAALQWPRPWWQRCWQPAKPLLAGASFSLTMMLLCLHWSLSVPVVPSAVGTPPPILTIRPVPSLDELLNQPNLTAGALASAWNEPPAPTPPVGRLPEPRRRAQIFHSPSLIV